MLSLYFQRWLCLILLAAGSVTTGAAFSEEPESQTSSLRCAEDADRLTIRSDGKPVLVYHKSFQEPPAGMDAVYRRNGYIHPIRTPSGRAVTGDFAADHPHQHGLFFAFVSTTLNGESVDFWNQRAETGRVVHGEVISIRNDKKEVGFTVTQLHQALVSEDAPSDVLHETWTITACPTQDGATVFDLRSELRCVDPDGLKINEYRYGGLAIRGADSLFRQSAPKIVRAWERALQEDAASPPPGVDQIGFGFLTSNGKGRHDGNHTRAQWVDLYGVVDGRPAGVTVLSHPSNFRAPQPVRLHPQKPYFCFAPMVAGAFELGWKEALVSRYRVIAHDGFPNVEALEAQYREYAAEVKAATATP